MLSCFFHRRSKKLLQLKLIVIVIISLISFLLLRHVVILSVDSYEKISQRTVDFLAPEISANYCDIIANTSRHEEWEDAIRWAEQWTYPLPNENVLLSIPTAEERCRFIKDHFKFNRIPLSQEEEQFPIAYGILVHRWYIQVYYMMSAIYHPQNSYCIAIDNKTSMKFKQTIFLLKECFPNIIVINAPTVYHCGNSVLDAVLSCLTELTLSDHPWRYYQYLSGVDLPLRTNKEMVRIFKRLNGSINSEVLKMIEEPFVDKLHKWIWPKDEVESIYGMELIKSSLSATFSRETARFFVGSEQSKALRSFIRRKWRLMCPDEYFWLTLAGNPKRIQMPGSFDAMKLLNDVEKRREIEKNNAGLAQKSIPYYISRYQRWIEKYNVVVSSKPCQGKYVRYSCVFGVRDIPNLLQRPELIVHKLYITYQPAAFFCLYKKVRQRAFNNDDLFNDEPYGNLPGPRIMRQQSVNEWANAL